MYLESVLARFPDTVIIALTQFNQQGRRKKVFRKS